MLDHLPAWESDSGRLLVVIETLKGSRNKYKYEPKYAALRLDKMLPLGTAFPYDFGFVPSTRAEDGDPIDVLVIMDEAAFQGCVVTARLLGVIEAEQSDQEKTIRNDRLIAVLDTARNPATLHSLDDLEPQRLDEIERFFISYNEAEGRRFKPLGRHGPKKAEKLVTAAMLDRPPNAHKQ